MPAKQGQATVSSRFSKAHVGNRLHANSGSRSGVMLRDEGSVTFLPPIWATFTPNVVVSRNFPHLHMSHNISLHGLVYLAR